MDGEVALGMPSMKSPLPLWPISMKYLEPAGKRVLMLDCHVACVSRSEMRTRKFLPAG